ncbi:MAG: hypothetical protein JF607_11165 [Burkholderiales bacterium]|jgi:hypothetical protein|nr:hypothetical protein [Burkholderiales bacterium]
MGKTSAVMAAWAALLLTGCASQAGRLALGVGGVGGLGNTPTNHIGQTYYLGAFDPREQLPATIYRVRIQGQASAISSAKFASGWVKSDLVDSLSGKVSSDEARAAESTDSTSMDKSQLDRRLVLFGPEGFREAPKNHRLVVVMGSSPEAFFGAVDEALGLVAGATQPTRKGPVAIATLQSELARLRQQRRGLDQLILQSPTE